ncbi:BKACE family enzyme [Halocatena halophila]|uniref:3-keto-5-aminohexanoate cleavage protein n=1 Tax=Halocatena halophila TaxID=2814576 RepID=UPI002ED0B781
MTFAEQDSIKGNDPDRAVISVALTGALTTREQCESIPYTPEEIAADAAAARDEGAAIAHIHARTDDGAPTYDPEVYQEIRDEVRARTDIVLNFSTGAIHAPPEQRIAYLKAVKPEIAALNMGSMNYAKYSTEREDFVFDMVFENSFEEIEQLLTAMDEADIRPELECFDAGHITNTTPFLDRGQLSTPLQFSLIMGVLGGIPATVESLIDQVRRLPPTARWQVIAISQDQWPLIAAALAMGGNVRVGLEDNFYLPDGSMGTNATLVEQAAAMTRSVGSEPATPEQARSILGLEDE